jgi:hypothetical protein
VVRDGLFKDITYGGGEPDLAIGYRFRDSGFKGGCVDDFRVFNRALTALEAADLAGRDDLRTAWKTGSAALFDYFLATAHPPTLQATAELRELRTAQNKLITPITEIMVMKELPEPKPAFVLKRGAYDMQGEQVTAGTPRVLPAFPANCVTQSARPGAMVDRSQAPVICSSNSEPPLANDVRARDR